jgi:hypothetical protein
VSVAALLVLIGLVRFLSYLKTASIGDAVLASPLGFLGYRPSSHLNVQFFKILATPTIVALVYFIFRVLNRRFDRLVGAAATPGDGKLDFRSPWRRLLLTTLATLHWLVLEWLKFSSPDSFYPYSPLEDRGVNVLVLLVSQGVAFLGMKYLSFAPLRTKDARS